MTVSGAYDSSAIRFYGITAADPSVPRDTLTLQGYIGSGGGMAKGDYLRSPAGKKGIRAMRLVECGAWTPKYPDPSCTAAKVPCTREPGRAATSDLWRRATAACIRRCNQYPRPMHRLTGGPH